MRACQEASFVRGAEIVNAMRGGHPAEIERILGNALKEWKATPETSAFYAARAFCIHELVPNRLPAGSQDLATERVPTLDVARFRDLGLEYFYYGPDGEWTLREDPVDLNELAAKHLDSRWGRHAFLMMTLMGWSEGACQEGPDQFRKVIKHGERFLKQYPGSEVSNRVRLELANAYATWWNRRCSFLTIMEKSVGLSRFNNNHRGKRVETGLALPISRPFHRRWKIVKMGPFGELILAKQL
jgi:hypothetical protein